MANELVHLLAFFFFDKSFASIEAHKCDEGYCASTVAKRLRQLGWSVFGLKEKEGPVNPWADISVVYMVCL